MDAFQTSGGNTSNIIIERNRVFMGNASTGALEQKQGDISVSGFILEGDQSDSNNPLNNVTIKNNIIEAHSGLNIGGAVGNVRNLKIYNNVFRSDLRFSSTSSTGISLWHGVTTYEIYNNITVDYPQNHIRIGATTTGGNTGNNLMWNSNGSTPSHLGYVLRSTDKRGVDPRFVSNFSNFHLQSSSPAINAGATISSVTNDLDGTSRPRPSGGAYDMGAFEF